MSIRYCAFCGADVGIPIYSNVYVESLEDEIKTLKEAVILLHESMITAEKRGHDKAMQEMESQDEV